MTPYQISSLSLLCVSVGSHLLHFPPKFFLKNHNENKATQLFCVIPAITPRIFLHFLFYITIQFSIVNLFEKAM